jgi:hypothetical protein
MYMSCSFMRFLIEKLNLDPNPNSVAENLSQLLVGEGVSTDFLAGVSTDFLAGVYTEFLACV